MKPTLKEMALYFLKLGTFVFGGPIVLCEHMRRDLVEDKKWITENEYSEGFALSQLAPGPLAAQLAIYLGWVRGGIPWATLIGVSFIFPSFLIVLCISAFYMTYGGLSWMQGAFYGVGASVIAIIAMSAKKLVVKTFKKDWLLWFLGSLSALITVWTEQENLWLFLLAGILVTVIRNPPQFKSKIAIAALPAFLTTGLVEEQNLNVLSKLFLFFAKSGAIVFGSGLAIVPFLHSGVVAEHAWLTERQFLDAVAVAMITPGPVVITVAFIGYLVSGPIGSFVSALGVFLPCYLFVIIPAPYFQKFAKNKTIKFFVDGVTTAAIGAIAGAAIVLGKNAVIDIQTSIIATASLLLLIFVKKIPEPVLILTAGAVGILLKG